MDVELLSYELLIIEYIISICAFYVHLFLIR